MADLHAALTNQVIAIGDSWRYQSGNLDSINWTSPAYDDSAWPSSNGVFGITTCNCLPAPIQTALSLATNPPTFQFRRQFSAPAAPGGLAIQINALLDDGAVFFLNGVEVLRVGLSNNPLSATNQATRTVGNASSYERFLLTGSNSAPLLAGINLLAVELHQAANPGNDVVFGCEVNLITNLPGNVIRGPYLQRGTWTNMVVRWRTDHPGNSRVWLGTNLANLNLIADDPTVTTNHEVNVKGLQPATRYFYAVGTATDLAAGSNSSHFFVTAPLPGTRTPTRVWVLGDSGTGDVNQLAVRNAYEAFTGSRHTDLWLMLGDNAYSWGTDPDYGRTVFDVYTSMLRKSVLWPTIGNHDTVMDTAYHDNYPYFDIFTLPKQGEAGGWPSLTEHYYSFDHANVHFVCLDSMTVPNTPTAVAAMKTWLAADSASRTTARILSAIDLSQVGSASNPGNEL